LYKETTAVSVKETDVIMEIITDHFSKQGSRTSLFYFHSRLLLNGEKGPEASDPQPYLEGPVSILNLPSVGRPRRAGVGRQLPIRSPASAGFSVYGNDWFWPIVPVQESRINVVFCVWERQLFADLGRSSQVGGN